MFEIQGVSLEIEGEKEVEILKDIDLKLLDKKLYSVTGPNGGGKSSLAKIIMGIYKPTSGKILLDGQDITDLNITERARLGIGYAFQHPPRFKGIKVKELLNMASLNNPDKVNLCDLLYDVGLCAQDYLNRDVDASLSGGEMKRIEIATVLARNLKLVVFDEPEAGIDLWSFQKLSETFSNIHMKYNTTIVIISHQERILELSDEIILMANGKVQEKARKDEILERILTNDSCLCSANCRKGTGQNAECIG
ncbi:MAG: ATP-binding cassette domain-containing protein [Clostridiaceae bacterium]|nr:ATP-binding cassette domain-containing protein [Clostridiaceae bacterium]